MTATPPTTLSVSMQSKRTMDFWHSFYFTSGRYPDTIEITKFDHKVTENACRHCHENITAEIDGNVVHGKAEGLQCTRCHNSVGHSESAAAQLNLPHTRSYHAYASN
jgi:cytochrome c nitrite reductase small subunit